MRSGKPARMSTSDQDQCLSERWMLIPDQWISGQVSLLGVDFKRMLTTSSD